MLNKKVLLQKAEDVLVKNDVGGWTQPSPGLYPHQWLWDSCFVAIGLRHTNISRAQREIRSLLNGQWENGMIPHIIFSNAAGYHAGPWLWNAHISPGSPRNLQTSGITQPPLLAEAVVRIGEKMTKNERKVWYEEVFEPISLFHEWLYRDRDPDRTGLVAIVHPWETGLDNTPPWMEVLNHYTPMPTIHFLQDIGLSKFIDLFRRDTSIVPAEERMSTHDLFAVYLLVQRLHHNKYDDKQILKKQEILVQDLAYNSILVRANEHLAEIARLIDKPLPPLVKTAHANGAKVLEKFWDEISGEYYPIDYKTRDLIKIQSIATFLPLYAGSVPEERLGRLLGLLKNPLKFGGEYLIPSAPVRSPYFKPHCYWQGPVWVNMNWMVIDGLRRNNRHKEAEELKNITLGLVSEHGMNEYFSTLDGSPAGAPDFSWTAALVIDLLSEN